VLDKSLERTIYTTFLASAFRSIRFGLNEAHGRGIAIQLNTLLDAGAFTVAADGSFAVDAAKIKDAVTALTREILTLERKGTTPRQGHAHPARRVAAEVKQALDRLGTIPVDIEPRFAGVGLRSEK